jgi:hypothetical protein
LERRVATQPELPGVAGPGAHLHLDDLWRGEWTMTNLTDRWGKPRLVLAIIALVVMVALVGVGIWGLANKPQPSTTPPPSAQPGPTASVPTQPKPARTPMLASSDPEVFTRQVAEALFTWDTTTGPTPDITIQQILAWGDPMGEESAGLATDLATYLPDEGTWRTLTTYAARQRLEIHDATVPATWRTAIAQAPTGTVLPGTTAVTVTATRHRDGTWNGKPETTSAPVAFTAFIVCGPAYPECHLLRLSQVDNPLR